MTVMSTIYLLDGDFPEADTYKEIVETYYVPGGETCNSAIVLSAIGHRVKIDGPYLGKDSKEGIEHYCNKFRIDCSNMKYDSEFIGVKDVVMVGGSTRTVFGWFKKYFPDSKRRWTVPDTGAIDFAKVVGLDPYFPQSSDEVALYCHKTSKEYVTIDSKYDSIIHKYSSVIIISKEYINVNYPNIPPKELMRLYTQNCEGLVIFTFGSGDIMYSRKSQLIQYFPTYSVDVKSTLGAGDTFRGGVLHGVCEGFADREIVEFACGMAACAISRFPMAHNPPSLNEIEDLIASRK